MKYLILLVMAVTLLGSACISQSAAKVPDETSTPTAAVRDASTGDPTNRVEKGPDLQVTPVADQSRGVKATPTTAPAAPPTATGPANEWINWRGNGYEFRYPRACQVIKRDQSMGVGARIELALVDSGGLNLIEYVNQFVDKQAAAGTWKLDSRQTESIGGNSAQRIEYRFGGTNRSGTAVFLERKGRIYAWQFSAGVSTCGEASAFRDIITSFRFVE